MKITFLNIAALSTIVLFSCNKENNNINIEESKRKSPLTEEKEPDVPLYSEEMLYYAAEKGLRGLVQKILSPQQNYPDKLSVPLGNAMSKAC